MVLENLNFTDVVPSIGSVIGSIPLIYQLNASRYDWKSIPTRSVAPIMANYLINSIDVDDEWDIAKKVSQGIFNSAMAYQFLDFRGYTSIAKYASILAVGTAFPLANYVSEMVIRPDEDHKSLDDSDLSVVPFSVVNTAISSIGMGYILDRVDLVPHTIVGISSIPFALSAFA